MNDDLTELAYAIWGMVRLAQSPLDTKRSIVPLIKTLEGFREKVLAESSKELSRIPILKQQIKLMQQQTAWEPNVSPVKGLWAIQNRHQRISLWTFDDGWKEVQGSSKPQGNYRALRILAPPGANGRSE